MKIPQKEDAVERANDLIPEARATDVPASEGQ
jgi:hypothetical protein